MRRMLPLLLLGCLGWPCAASVLRAEEPLDGLAERVAGLIQHLGDDDYFVRERAQAELAGLGFEAFDALEAAQNSDDIEVAARAKYLMRKMRFDWASEGDPPEVRHLLKDYEEQQDTTRIERMQNLVKLADDAGLAGLCRLVRFEQSPVRSKLAALALIEHPAADGTDWDRRERTVNESLRKSGRPGAQWLRTYLLAHRDPAKALEEWARQTQAEEQTLAQYPDQSQNGLVLSLLRQQVELLEQLQRDDEALAVMRRMVMLETGDSQTLTELVNWLVRHKAWSVIDELATRFSATFDQDALLLYTLAQARDAQGRHDLAEEVAARARSLNPSDSRGHWLAAVELRDRGLLKWAELEYRYVIDLGPPGNPYTLVCQWSLAELLHDREAELAAAQTLEPSVAAMEENLRQGNAQQNVERDPAEIRARMHYFFACHFLGRGDRAKQIEHLEAGIKDYPLDADVLIALYRLPDRNPEQRSRLLQSIQAAAVAFRQQIEDATIAQERASANRNKATTEQEKVVADQEKTTADRKKATACNQLAWLVGNTEGDQAEALRSSQTSLELEPNEAGYLDTLARCYYAQGDLENAVKFQSRAVELEPHSGQMSRQLKFFQEELARKQKP